MYNIDMKKEKFIKLFKIEEATIKSIKYLNNNLYINVSMDVISYAMGNNIREENINSYDTKYVFLNAVVSCNFLDKITHIYNTYLSKDSIILETNMGMINIVTDEIILEEV